MLQSKRKYKYLSLNHQIFKENNNNYEKHIECLQHNQSHILSLIHMFSNKHDKIWTKGFVNQQRYLTLTQIPWINGS